MLSTERNQHYTPLSTKPHRDYVRQIGGHDIFLKKPKNESLLFSGIKKSVLWIGILSLISIAAVIGLATLLLPAYAMGLALAPSVSMTTKVAILIGIPLFWFFISVAGHISDRK